MKQTITLRKLERRVISFSNRTKEATDLIDNAMREREGKVLAKDFKSARLITINHEQALNATNLGMIAMMRHNLFIDRHPQDITFSSSIQTKNSNSLPTKGTVYITTGVGDKSYCAGGDIVALIQNKPKGAQFAAGYIIYTVCYHMWLQSHGKGGGALHSSDGKPHRNKYVALWNGYVMGGGVGYSLHGQYRVACPQSMFAMPENTLGFYPDCGAGYFLPRLDRPSEYHKGAGIPGVGLYLGLLGARVKGADLVHTGLATHYVKDLATLRKLQDELCGVGPGQVEEVLDAHAVPYEQLPPFTLEAMRPLLERTFTLRHNTTVEDVVAQLVKEAGDASQPVEIRRFAEGLLDKLPRISPKDTARVDFPPTSPTSLKIALESMQRGDVMTDPFEMFAMDAAGIVRSSRGHEFQEGVNALLVRKDKKPRWVPDNLEDVNMKVVKSFAELCDPIQAPWDPWFPAY